VCWWTHPTRPGHLIFVLRVDDFGWRERQQGADGTPGKKFHLGDVHDEQAADDVMTRLEEAKARLAAEERSQFSPYARAVVATYSVADMESLSTTSGRPVCYEAFPISWLNDLLPAVVCQYVFRDDGVLHRRRRWTPYFLQPRFQLRRLTSAGISATALPVASPHQCRDSDFARQRRAVRFVLILEDRRVDSDRFPPDVTVSRHEC